MIVKLLLLLNVVIFVLAPLNSQKAADEDRKMIEGTWMLVSAELSGQKLPDGLFKDAKLILTEGKYTYQNSQESDQGTYKLNTAEKPKAMDISGAEGPNKGKTFPAIYELEGDNLKICYDLSGKSRPDEFTTKSGTQQFLAIYKRAKSSASQ